MKKIKATLQKALKRNLPNIDEMLVDDLCYEINDGSFNDNFFFNPQRPKDIGAYNEPIINELLRLHLSSTKTNNLSEYLNSLAVYFPNTPQSWLLRWVKGVEGISVFDQFGQNFVNLGSIYNRRPNKFLQLENKLFPKDDELSGALGEIELDTTDYDSKHINNLAPNKDIPESIITDLNRNGLTVENIEKLQDSGFPVCKYKTQITVHGNCPKLKSNYVGEYSCLVKNQNNSLGIKWNGIDAEKKSRIIHLAFEVNQIFQNKDHIVIKNNDYSINNRWNRYWNSTTTYLWQRVSLKGIQVLYYYPMNDEDKKNVKEIAEKVSEKLKGLFFGYVEINNRVIKIVILGIYEKNIDNFCKALFGYTQSEIKDLYNDYEELVREKRKLDTLKRQKAEKERDEYFEEWKKQNPLPENFVPINRYPINGDIIADYVNDFSSVKISDKGYYFDKENFKPQIEYLKFYYSFGKLCYRHCDQNGNFTERRGEEFRGSYPKEWFIKTTPVIIKPPISKPENTTITSSNGNTYSLLIVDYSDKGIVLTGDTKPIKEEIKALGGKFSSHFDTSKVPSGIGWIFPKTKLAEVEKLVAKYSAKEEKSQPDKTLQMLELQLLEDNLSGYTKLDVLSGLTPINKLKRINQNETELI